jgi:hypothetical protein
MDTQYALKRAFADKPLGKRADRTVPGHSR